MNAVRASRLEEPDAVWVVPGAWLPLHASVVNAE